MSIYVGLDWGSQEHAVCVLDPSGTRLAQFTITHNQEGLRQLRHRLSILAPPNQIRVALERPSGLLVDSLVETGYTVVPIHPNIVKATRPRYSSAAAKSDRSDALLLADLLRTDEHRFRPLTPECDALKALRALVRTRDDLIATRIELANQLRALLESFWPGAAAIFADIDSPIALAFLLRYPTPGSAAHLGEKRLASFLAQHRYCGRRGSAELLQRLRSAPLGRCGGLESQAKGELVRCLSSVLTTLVEQLRQISSRIEHEVAALEDGQRLMSFPRIGRINAAQLLAELGCVRARFPTDSALACEAGVSPVTRQSGKSHAVVFRWACNKRLRVALTTFAHNSTRASPWAAAIYARARARGIDHPHAIRILARAWVRVLWRTWTDHQPYDPTKHRNAAPLLAAA
ncbi:MAG TPA: IS110 family transposase [Steroidobacteraceae bacterium]|nr:IS110 family transposase [Steroidobacteraceae bacterium]